MANVAHTNAKMLFCLSDKDLEQLTPRTKKNPHNRKGPPMRLYPQEEVETLATAKWGSPEALSAELDRRRNAREAKRRKTEAASGEPNSSAGPSSVAHTSPADEAGPPQSSAAAETPSSAAPQTAPAPAVVLGSPGGLLGRLPPAASPVVSPDGTLHPLIAERIRTCRQASTSAAAAACVLYWMRTAVRGHENPALDVARSEAARRQLPLVVAAFVMPKDHLHPTHRRFSFLLQGLRDAQAELKQQGQQLLVYLEGCMQQRAKASGQLPVNGWAALLELASKSAVVITEEMPVDPEASQLQALGRDLPPHVQLLAVDASCLVPMRLTKQAYEKAWQFRPATSKLREERLKGLPYPARGTPGTPPAATPGPNSSSSPGAAAGGHLSNGFSGDAAAELIRSLPWQPLDLTAEGVGFQELLRRCGWVDHSVPAVEHLPGGSVAGYARWDAFRRAGLDQYAARRNSPLSRDAVSRLSAYHHYGMVSPFKVAREAAAIRTNGARKFLDEYLTWREIAYHYCFHRWPAIYGLEAVPKWARETLLRHAGDAREVKALPDLEVGNTGNLMWDAAQHQLVTTGELHNNVRMSWGKAVLPWTASPDAAIKAALHLNDRYALDGCDPCSIGGVLWCFGLFDKPWSAERTPVYGTLRMRPMSVLQKKFTAEVYKNLAIAAGEAAAGGSSGKQMSMMQFFKPRS